MTDRSPFTEKALAEMREALANWKPMDRPYLEKGLAIAASGQRAAALLPGTEECLIPQLASIETQTACLLDLLFALESDALGMFSIQERMRLHALAQRASIVEAMAEARDHMRKHLADHAKTN